MNLQNHNPKCTSFLPSSLGGLSYVFCQGNEKLTNPVALSLAPSPHVILSVFSKCFPPYQGTLCKVPPTPLEASAPLSWDLAELLQLPQKHWTSDKSNRGKYDVQSISKEASQREEGMGPLQLSPRDMMVHLCGKGQWCSWQVNTLWLQLRRQEVQAQDVP